MKTLSKPLIQSSLIEAAPVLLEDVQALLSIIQDPSEWTPDEITEFTKTCESLIEDLK